jgi:branched-chain amino acid transport system ATP-binding protein
MLTLSSVSKHFGGLSVLRDISLNVPGRDIFGLIGPNGAGKTTVFNLITGLLTPNEGTIEFFGNRLDGLPPYRIARHGVARTFQNIRLFKEMTALDNVLVALRRLTRYGDLAALLPRTAYWKAEQRERETAHALLSRVGLGDKANLAAGILPYGEQRRVEIARALATGPKLLLLDEPAAGMNAAEKRELMDEIVHLAEDGLNIMIIEHDMRFIMEVCRDIVVLNFGRMIARGSPEEIRANPLVIEAYLGSDDPSAAAFKS